MLAEITSLLDQLSDLESMVDTIRIQKQDAVPADVRTILADIDAEFDPAIESANQGIRELQNRIRELVIANGMTAKGKFKEARFVSGKASWNDKMLNGYSAAHPEILAFRKVGQPYVSFYNVKE